MSNFILIILISNTIGILGVALIWAYLADDTRQECKCYWYDRFIMVAVIHFSASLFTILMFKLFHVMSYLTVN